MGGYPHSLALVPVMIARLTWQGTAVQSHSRQVLMLEEMLHMAG